MNFQTVYSDIESLRILFPSKPNESLYDWLERAYKAGLITEKEQAQFLYEMQ